MIKIDSDIIKLPKSGEYDILVHSCNCFCTMGAGLAKQIKKEFPEAYQADQNTVLGSCYFGKIQTKLNVGIFK